jgi:hypothetical protein
MAIDDWTVKPHGNGIVISSLIIQQEKGATSEHYKASGSMITSDL